MGGPCHPAHQDELVLVLQFLKGAVIWFGELGIDYWQDWINPPDQFVNWIRDRLESNEFFFIYLKDRPIGCNGLQWEDKLFWGQRDYDSGYVHPFTIL